MFDSCYLASNEFHASFGDAMKHKTSSSLDLLNRQNTCGCHRLAHALKEEDTIHELELFLFHVGVGIQARQAFSFHNEIYYNRTLHSLEGRHHWQTLPCWQNSSTRTVTFYVLLHHTKWKPVGARLDPFGIIIPLIGCTNYGATQSVSKNYRKPKDKYHMGHDPLFQCRVYGRFGEIRRKP